jgi:hypothetical protein
MKRIANLAMVAILAGCGSDSNGPIEQPIDPPSGKFSGSWSGSAFYAPYSADTLDFTVVATEGAGNVAGTVNYQAIVAQTIPFTGTSTPPTVNFAGPSNISTYTYAGTYITTDSIAGTMDYNGFQTDALNLKKISGASDGTLNGTWSGADSAISSPPLYLVLIATQTGSMVTASGVFTTAGPVDAFYSFTGTTTPSTVSFKWTVAGTLLRYTGTYITSDSIAGILKINGVDDVVLSLKRN